MIRDFFRISLRNIAKNKGVTFINITGLAVGLAASILILLWIQNELSYDKFHLNGENVSGKGKDPKKSDGGRISYSEALKVE